MYSLLEAGQLDRDPLVVLHNSRVYDPSKPYERNQCCINRSDPLKALVGPWNPLLQLLSSHPLRTPRWLYNSPPGAAPGKGV
eukprot:9373139-Pyramimonas_sp.AAC.1